MYQAIEAISKSGMIQLLEPVQFEDWRKFVGILKSSPIFGDDPEAIQQEMPNDWD